MSAIESERQADMKTHRDLTFSVNTVNSPKQLCNDDIELGQVVEVVNVKGTEVNQPVYSRKQYINLDETFSPGISCPEYGRRIKLKAQIRWKSGNLGGLAGNKVYWLLKSGKHNRENLPNSMKATFGEWLDEVPTKNRAISPPKDIQIVTTLNANTDDDGWTATVCVTLSRYGGDKVMIFASCNPFDKKHTPKDDESIVTYTVWRKVFYELDCMKQENRDDTYETYANTQNFASILNKSKLELVRIGNDDKPNYEPIIFDASAETWAARFRQSALKHSYVHVLVVDSIAYGPYPRTEVHSFNPQQRYRFNIVQGDLLVRQVEEGEDVNRPAYMDPKAWFSSVTYAHQKKKNIPIDGSCLTLVSGEKAYEITIDLTKLGLDDGHDVTVTVILQLYMEVGGLRKRETLVVGTRSNKSIHNGRDLDQVMLITLLHEAGHAMGLAAERRPHGRRCRTTEFTNGYHCKNNCIMYRISSPDPHPAFCKRCDDALKGRDLRQIPLSGKDVFS